MKTKRLALLVALLMSVTTLTGCTPDDDIPTTELNYQSAITLLQEGKYAEAGTSFAQLGHYYEASRYTMYCNALASAEKGDYALAASTMQALAGFMDSSILAIYYTGRACEKMEDYETALAQYSLIRQYGDAGSRADAIPGKIQERDYKAACALEEGKQYPEAIAAFTALDGFKDSEARIESIHSAMEEQNKAEAYEAADGLEAAGNLQEAMDAFQALGDYSDCAERVIAIEGKLMEQQYQNALKLEEANDLVAAKDAFLMLGDYADAKDRASAIENKLNEEKYQKALKLEEMDDVAAAYDAYIALGEYGDAASRAASLKDEVAYRSAFALVEKGEYAKARAAYEGLGEYKDCAEKARLLGVCELATQTKALNSGVIAFEMQELWGYIDLINNHDVAPAYSSIGRFSAQTGLAIVSDYDYYGLIDRAGRLVNDRGYLDLKEGENGFYSGVLKGSKYTYTFTLINAEGQELSTWRTLGFSENSNITSKYNSYYNYGPSFTNGTIIAQDTDDTYSLINSQGEVLIGGADGIDLIRRITANDTVRVFDERKGYQLFNLDGTALDENRWSSISQFKGGFAAVCDKTGKWGYIGQTDGHIVIPPQYSAAQDFSNDLAAVKVGKAWGFIDASNNMVIEPQYLSVTDFENDKAAVNSYSSGWQVIDTTGKLLYFKQNSYLAADALDEKGRYEEAIAAFESLEGYADSAERALQSREKINAKVYAQADELETNGWYMQAAEAFEWLGDYSDAPARAAAARETQNANTYAEAKQYEDAGYLEEAIAIYLTLGEYNGSVQHAADLRESINQGICQQAAELEENGEFENAIAVLNQIPDYTGVAEHIASLEEKIRVRDYNAAAALEDEGKFEEAIVAFTAMGDYSDSAERIVILQGKIQQRDYNAAAALEDEGKFEEAILAFTAMGDYSDSAERIVILQGKIQEREYNIAAALEDEGKFEEAIVAFTAMGDYSDAADRIVVLEGKIQQREYDAACALEEAGNYTEAYAAFVTLGEFSDSAARAVSVAEKAEEQRRQAAYTAAADAESNDLLETAASGFEALGDYKDAPARLAAVQEKIRTRDYSAAVAAMAAEDYNQAIALLTGLEGYENSTELLGQAQIGARYQTAVKDALAGKLTQAYNEFVALGDYKDSAKKAEICGNLSRASKTKQITEGVLIYEFHELWGIANLNTNVITAAKYTSITYDAKAKSGQFGLLKVFLKGGEYKFNPTDTYGYINHNGKEVIPCKYYRVSEFNDDGNCTVATFTGEKRYSYSSSYYYRFLYGIMNNKGEMITKPQWRTLGASTNTNWDASDEPRWWDERSYSYYSSKSELCCNINQPKYSNGRMLVQTPDEKYGYIDAEGKILGEVKWYSIGNYLDGMAMVCEEVSTGRYSTSYKYGFINEQGQTIGDVCWDSVSSFSHGYAAVLQNGYWGFINKNNELVIPCQFVEVANFREDGTCDVKTTNGTWQVINTKGEVAFF